MTENEISKILAEAAIEVHRELRGPGLLEDVFPVIQVQSSLQCYPRKFCISNKLFATKERKEHINRRLCRFFFAIFVIFCG